MIKKLLLFVIPFLLASGIFFGMLFFLNRSSGKGALQVTSQPRSKVYLNDKLIGETPLCKCDSATMLDVGEYTIRLVPQDTNLLPFSEKITLTKSVLTVVDRTFEKGIASEGSIITLTPLKKDTSIELSILSFPQDLEIFLNSSDTKKKTPTLFTDLTESDQEITLRKIGYKDKTIRIKTVKGYKLTVIAYLGVDPQALTIEPSPLPDESKEASSSANIKVLVTILQTPTGFLRVRENASISAKELIRIKPGEKYELLEEKDGWFGIKLSDGQTGWISAQYAKKEDASSQ